MTSDEDGRCRLRQGARGAIGQERILVNCAGTGNAIKTASRSKEDGSIKHFPLEAFDWLIQINLVGTFRCIAKSAAGMMTLDPLEEGGDRGASSTPLRSLPKTARSARQLTRLRRAASSA